MRSQPLDLRPINTCSRKAPTSCRLNLSSDTMTRLLNLRDAADELFRNQDSRVTGVETWIPAEEVEVLFDGCWISWSDYDTIEEYQQSALPEAVSVTVSPSGILYLTLIGDEFGVMLTDVPLRMLE